MNYYTSEQLSAPKLSSVRQFLFWSLAIVWFCEMLFLGVPFLNRVWIEWWHVAPPEDSQLATASMLTGAVGAPVKGAFFVMAVYGLNSKNPVTRTALFMSMSLVPPLNVAFPFRYQGFVLGPTMVGSVLSTVLWVSCFLFGEPYRQQKPHVKENAPSGWEIFQYILFTLTSVALTILAVLFLFFPGTALQISFPCLPGILNSSQQELPGMIYHSMASGTHLLALSVGSWIATINCRRNPTLRQAMTIASTVFTALFFIFPIRQTVVAFGVSCVTSSVLYAFALLLIGWVTYAAFLARPKTRTTSVFNEQI